VGRFETKKKEHIMAVEQEIKNIIMEKLGVNAEQLTPEASFTEDLGADSLDMVDLLTALEEKYGTIPESDNEKLKTVGSAIEYLKSKGVK
jgi:acyl carrier protein